MVLVVSSGCCGIFLANFEFSSNFSDVPGDLWTSPARSSRTGKFSVGSGSFRRVRWRRLLLFGFWFWLLAYSLCWTRIVRVVFGYSLSWKRIAEKNNKK